MKVKKKAVLLLIVVLALGAAGVYYIAAPKEKGYQDYTVQKKQYYVEYSEKYDYWDVLTVTYPCVEGIEEKTQEQINQLLYDTAMDRVNYWHLAPDSDIVRTLQKDYQLFASDVQCEVTCHNPYFLSVRFDEIYAPGSPIYNVNSTKRAVTVNLLTGEAYELTQILRIDEEFIRLWCKKAGRIYEGVISDDEETCGVMLTWFLGTDEELNDYFEFRPYFYVTEDKEVVVGIATDVKDKGLTDAKPSVNAYEVYFTAEELESFCTETEFWERYAESESCGNVYECENPADNLWLGEDASTWDYWEERQ